MERENKIWKEILIDINTKTNNRFNNYFFFLPNGLKRLSREQCYYLDYFENRNLSLYWSKL